MKVNIAISWQLEVATDDFKRMKSDDATDLLRALQHNNAVIKTSVTEVYQKPEPEPGPEPEPEVSPEPEAVDEEPAPAEEIVQPAATPAPAKATKKEG
jgi:hypothetical protein